MVFGLHSVVMHATDASIDATTARIDATTTRIDATTAKDFSREFCGNLDTSYEGRELG